MYGLERAGGEPRLVGGIVRDQVMAQLGYPVIPSRDVDIEVLGLSADEITAALEPNGKVNAVGASFGVLKLTLPDGEQIDVSLPRRESKLGAGHRGFQVEPDPNMTLTEAASRRDFTMNSVSADSRGNVDDPFCGVQDMVDHILRATSERFADDPLRVLRGVQFAARFNLTMESATIEMARKLLPEFKTLSAERIWTELAKFAQSNHPAAGFAVLEQTGWLAAFPELALLQHTPQDPVWHPEGDVWTHAKLSVDQAARIATREKLSRDERETLVLAALLHDIGKPGTTEERNGHIISHGHAELGADIAQSFLQNLRAPDATAAKVSKLVREHMIHTGAKPLVGTVRRLARRLASTTPEAGTNVRMLALLTEADASARHPAPPASPMKVWVDVAERNQVDLAAPRPILMGRHLISAGLKPGPLFGLLLARAFEAQMDGEFDDEAGALAWLQHHKS